jgi:hypothetical protein
MMKETVIWGRFGFVPGKLPLRRKVGFTRDADWQIYDREIFKFGK